MKLNKQVVKTAMEGAVLVIRLSGENRNSLTSSQYLRTIPDFFQEGQRPGCIAGDKFLYVDQQGYIKQCPELPPIAHISKLDEMRTEFVCIPRPIKRAESPDGGPLRYRVVHSASLWKPGEKPVLRRQVIEGDPGLSI